MRSWVLAAGLLAARDFDGAQAADLDDGPPPDRYGSAYDDPRYADIYKYPGRRRTRPEPTPCARRSRASASIATMTKHDYDHRARGAIPTPSRPPYAGRCVPREAGQGSAARAGLARLP